MAKLQDDCNKNVCLPIKTLSDVMKYETPAWSNLVVPLKKKTSWCVASKDIQCHVDPSEWYPLTRYDRHTVPKTLVCHDMRGGYLEDRYVHGHETSSPYIFKQWWNIDTFVYFSHNFITIPPLGWINAAHTHGVEILGTIITEADSGKELISHLLKFKKRLVKFVDIIVKITRDLNFDGWLLNIENDVQDLPAFTFFVKHLSNSLHAANQNFQLIWYDSITSDGKLMWQNSLNNKNSCWFDYCDGIFLNYNWTEEDLRTSLRNAAHRSLNVYAGIDVFGRNCIGELNSYKALELIRKYNLSVAIFAPGWTHETTESSPRETFYERYLTKDKQLWESMRPYLYEHGICEPFDTFFKSGYRGSNLNLCELEVQPMSHVYLGNKSLYSIGRYAKTHQPYCFCVQYSREHSIWSEHALMISNSTKKTYIHRLMMCDIECKKSLSFIVYAKNISWESNPKLTLDLILLIKEKNGRYKTHTLSGRDVPGDNSIITPSDPRRASIGKNFNNKLCSNTVDINVDWDIRYYTVEMPNSSLIEIGAMLTGLDSIGKNNKFILHSLYIQED